MKDYRIKINGNFYHVHINDIDEYTATVEVNGTPYRVQLEGEIQKTAAAKKPVSAIPKAQANNPAITIAAPSAPVSKPAMPSHGSSIKAPLPGVVLEIIVKPGDVVKPGQKLLTLEAMKMENNILADRDGTVSEIKITQGQSVLEGTDLIIIE
ncbi:MAG: acetyl-CoA carboxylase biotin carboxyl carrier protein subunit [Candidatus Azobacteroides sp.]|nr:acetyl-CoA carboxylase biotin carboxyl carrier protein subunit [Candidatus Azobacteroides sp.]